MPMPVVKFGRLLLAVVVASVVASPVLATSNTNYTTYPNGTRLTANVWGQTAMDWDGCSDWTSSSVINATPSWIRNTIKLQANGPGAYINSWSYGGSGNPVSASWTNSGGQRGAYLSGYVCPNLWTWWTSAWSTATALHAGVVRSVTASI